MPERGSGGYDPTAAGRAYRSVRRDDRRLKPDSGGGRVTASPDPVPRAGRRHQSRRYQSCRRLLSVGTACPGGPIGSSGCAPFLEPGRWSLTAPRPSFRWRLQVSVANVKFTGNPAAESFGALLGNQSRIRRRRRFKTGPVSWRSPNSFPIPAERKRPGGGLADVAERPLFRKTSIRLVRRLVADFPQKGGAPNGRWSTGRSASAAAV